MPEEKKCASCGKRIESETDWVEFKCPKCGKSDLIRCSKCKRLENKYICPECSFEGP
jgi:predicted RNA-binding Zn-ribbon protein involved in translation (DUF1610 family)